MKHEKHRSGSLPQRDQRQPAVSMAKLYQDGILSLVSVGNCTSHDDLLASTVGYMSGALVQQNIHRLLMERYNWRRPHQFNEGLAPAQADPRIAADAG
ncbi:hypothetical protein [Pseudomonas sp. CFBP 13719]|uniref:hypothetical protein n=1 Tax=Pseudomonas sp. CFBP 13719 TaxID=2775303 RepID=UPI0017863A75|nr:hypothetical protein [Pseudomonas sp. CFBP 13719]